MAAFFGMARRGRQERAGFRLYAAAVAAARDPFLYRSLGVADTVDGRFDLVCLHAYLLVRRLQREAEPGPALAQAVFDAMFSDMDVSLREMGVGDLSVGRRVRAMWEAFNGRVLAYEAAQAADNAALTAAGPAAAARDSVRLAGDAAPADFIAPAADGTARVEPEVSPAKSRVTRSTREMAPAAGEVARAAHESPSAATITAPAGCETALKAALIRNVWRGVPPPDRCAASLARVVAAQAAFLDSQEFAALAAGDVSFRPPEEVLA